MGSGKKDGIVYVPFFAKFRLLMKDRKSNPRKIRESSGLKIIRIKSSLSATEIQIIKWICREKTSFEIARKMNFSPRTIEAYRLNIIRKTKTKGSIGLFKFAIKSGIYEI